ncbi:MAG: DNA polymerase III subunit gamma/tau [Acidobacteriota bacterium]|jgi:DNA polymerase-3 subunit gamma/tau|nr:DNA polymerase III subunit gamma/tau [Acidobacteriota bacterium]
MQYQVLARKWRPRNFHELVGQEHVSRSLLNALTGGRLAHAFLFSGPRGSGKTTSARILAKALNCHAGKPGEPCDECPSCVEVAAGTSMDVLEIDAASNRGIDDIRELRDEVRYNPARDRNKIFIIDEVHMLTTEAFNALLKTLEEPPPNVVFILATTEYHKVPATILSRCQKYTFKLIPYPMILDRLREIAQAEGVQISDGALEQVTFASGGSMRDAMSALDQVLAFSGSEVRDEDVAALLGLVETKVLGRTVHAIAGGDTATLLQVVADLVESGQDLNNFCRRLSGQFRNLMVLKAGVTDTAMLGVPESLLPELRTQADLFSREDLIRLFDTFQKIEAAMKYAAQVRFQLEMGLIELSHVARLRPIEDLIAEFAGRAGGAESAPEGATRPTARPARPQTPPAQQRTPSAGAPQKDSPADAPAGADELLVQVAMAVQQESLRSLLQSLAGARLEGDRLVLDPGDANDFTKNSLRRNLGELSTIASGVFGRQVSAVMAGELPGASAPTPAPAKAPKPQPAPSSPSPSGSSPDSEKDALMEKAQQHPVMRSFFDNFPGERSAEKID